MPKSSVLSPHVRSQGGFLTEKWGPWRAGLFGSLRSDEPSVPITVVGPEPWEQHAPLFDDLSPQYERMLAKVPNKHQTLGKAGRARRRGRRRDDAKFYGGRVSHEQLHAREQQAHYVAVMIPSPSFGDVGGYWTIHDERPHRVMQDTSLPSPYSLEEREEHGPREFGLEAATQLWRQLTIDEAVSIGNFLKLVGHGDEPDIQEQLGVSGVDQALMEALEELRGVQEEAEEEGTAVPSNALVQRAEEALRVIHTMARRTYDVYAMPYGDIVIDIEVPARCKLVVICREDGCFRGLMATDEGKQDEQYGQVKELPLKPFLREALDKLAL